MSLSLSLVNTIGLLLAISRLVRGTIVEAMEDGVWKSDDTYDDVDTGDTSAIAGTTSAVTALIEPVKPNHAPIL